MSAACVIDASAVLAHLFGERGCDEVADWLDRGAAISTVNALEVMAKLVDLDTRNGVEHGQALADARQDFDALVLEVADLTFEDAVQAGGWAPLQRSHDLGAGDRCCLALGRRLALPVVHAERKWQSLSEMLGLELVLVREAR